MPTPAKPINILRMEKKAHYTKRDLASRERAENSLLTGQALKATTAVRGDADARKEFNRVKKLLTAIGKDDDLYGTIINRYCLLASEEAKLQARWMAANERLEHFDGDDEAYVYGLRALADIDKQLQAKRKMLFDIEKENVMTVASALRSVPKTQGATKKNLLLEALADEG